jgi:hypothetical protein
MSIDQRLGKPAAFVAILNDVTMPGVEFVSVCTPSVKLKDVGSIVVRGKSSPNAVGNVKLPETLSVVVYWGAGAGLLLRTVVKWFPV